MDVGAENPYVNAMGKRDSGADTPVMLQYRAAKAEHPDALLFFRLGDFYELFFEDAVTAAEALDLTLTSRNKSAADPIPMAGVPYHAASAYIQRLLDRGFRVALCEQMADPKEVKGIVPREVVRVVTPAMPFDEAGLDARSNNYLAVVRSIDGAHALAAIDASTGELVVTEARDEPTLIGHLARIEPREIVVDEPRPSFEKQLELALGKVPVRAAGDGVIIDDAAKARELVLAYAPDAERLLDGLSRVALAAVASGIASAQACEIGRRVRVMRVVVQEDAAVMALDERTQRHLELVRTQSGEIEGSLLRAIDRTKTPGGARRLRQRIVAPSTDRETVTSWLDAVEAFVTQPGLRQDVRELLGSVKDIERLTVRAQLGRAMPRDLGALAHSLAAVPEIVDKIAKIADHAAKEALGVPKTGAVDVVGDLAAELSRAMVAEPPAKLGDEPAIAPGFDGELDEARELAQGGKRHIVELESRLRETTGIGTLKARYSRVFGWYIEVTRTHAGKAPPAWRRKQTVANGERFACDELDELADRLGVAEERARELEKAIVTRLVARIDEAAPRLVGLAERIAEWDVAAALAELARQNDYVRPAIDGSLALDIVDGRHPVVEQMVDRGAFVPNDVCLSAESEPGELSRLWLLTGPNMAGKSTLMRQVALICILAQAGSYVPAKRARIGIVDRVLTRVGASDNLARGESTFMVEMKECAAILRSATRRSLVVLDEIGRGTSTFDGMAIAWAVLEYLHEFVRCRALFATHYHELTELPSALGAADNFSVSAREHEGEIVFLHRLQHGAVSKSYGVACARLAGLPAKVLDRAEHLLVELEGRAESDRAKAPGGAAQLGLFATRRAPERATPTEAPAIPQPHPAIAKLRSLDIERLTPIEALNVLSELSALAGRGESS